MRWLLPAKQWLAADERRGVVIAALVAYGFWSLIWPVGAGRDFGSYAMTLLELPRRVADYPFQSAFRTPLTPLFIGFACWPGRWFAGLVLAFGYVLVALSIHAVARPRHAGAAWLAVAMWLIAPSGGWMFRHIDSGTLTAILVAPWAAALCRADAGTSNQRWAGHGLMAAALVLTRPANLLFGAVLLAPLAMPGVSVRRRLAGALAFGLAFGLPLAGWALHNHWLYQDLAISRGSGAFMPLVRVMVFDDLVRPENGPASARLADAVRRRLLWRHPYPSWGVDVDRFFRLRSTGSAGDLILVCDAEWGWDSDYAALRAVAMEAIARQPGVYARRVASDVWWLFAACLPRSGQGVDLSGEGAWSWLESRPAGYPQPRYSGQGNVVEVYAASRLAAYERTAEARPRWRWWAQRWDKAQLPMAPWLVLGLVGLWPCRDPRCHLLGLLVWLAVAGLVVTELGMWLIPEYRWPFDSLCCAYGAMGLARWLPTWRASRPAVAAPSAPR